MAVLPDDRAQSETLGSLLLVAVVVVSVGTFGVYYVASSTGGGAGGAAGGAGGTDNFDFAVAVTPNELRISHNGGPSVAAATLRVTVENASGEYTYVFSNGTISGGNGDDRFEPGEAWRLVWDQSSNTEVTVSLVDIDTDQLLFRESLTIESSTTVRPAVLAEGEDTDSEFGGEDGGEKKESAEDSAGDPSGPWLDFDNDGIFDSEDKHVDLSSGSIPEKYANTSSATLRVPSGVTVDTGGKKIDIRRAGNVQIAGTLKTRKKIVLSAPGTINISNGRLDNNGGNRQLTLDSGSGIDARNTSIYSGGKITVSSEEAMTLHDAVLDNSDGNGGIDLTVETSGDISLVGSEIRSTGDAVATVQKASDEVDVTDAIIDDSDNFLEVNPSGAVTGEPESGGPSKEAGPPDNSNANN